MVDLPKNPKPAELHLTPNHATGSIKAMDWTRRYQDWDNFEWELEIESPHLNETGRRNWLSFYMRVKNTANSFTAPIPGGSAPGGNATASNPQVDSTNSDNTTLTTSGWNANVTDLFVGGDFLKINGEVVVVKTNVDSDGSGNADIDIAPGLRTDPSSGDAIEYEDLDLSFRISDPSYKPTFEKSGPIYSPIVMPAVEDI